jgi:hypothetical protein
MDAGGALRQHIRFVQDKRKTIHFLHGPLR